MSSSFSLACRISLALSIYPLCSCSASHQHFNIISSVTNFIYSPPVSMPTHPPAPQTPGGGNNWLEPDTPTVVSNQIRGLVLHISSNQIDTKGAKVKRERGALDTHIKTQWPTHCESFQEICAVVVVWKHVKILSIFPITSIQLHYDTFKLQFVTVSNRQT